MSLTPFEDILALSKAPSADPAKSDAIKELAELKIQLDGMSWSVPDNQDDLVEDQEMWCARWQKLLNQVHTSFQHMKEHSVDTALKADLLTWMQGVNSLSCRWLGAAVIWKQQEEERVEMVVLAWAAKVAGLESADEPPTTEWPSKEHESVSSAGQKRKCVSSRVVVEEEKDDRDDIVEVVAPKPSKAQTSSKTLKTKCGKSKGKAGKVKKDTALIASPKAKGKEKVQPRPVRNNACMVIPVCKAPVASSSRVEANLPDFLGFSLSPESDSDHEDDDTMPCKKVKLVDLAQDMAVETMKLVLLTMRMKMHGMLSFLTKLQACVKVPKTYISSQQLEIEEMEALLEKL
ncbi:hypothetical protein HD554DRAFT_2175130 [Boletus coccyginus]|nr:hypothetical protein HD554DRAFT_2175130 [Boletus coccyginus]